MTAASGRPDATEPLKSPVMTRLSQRAADGTEFAYVIDVAPEDVAAEHDRVRTSEGDGVMFLPDRRIDFRNKDHRVVWQVWISALVGWEPTTEGEPVPLPFSQSARWLGS